MKKLLLLTMCLMALAARAQVKVCMSYEDFKAANILPILVQKGMITDYHHHTASK